MLNWIWLILVLASVLCGAFSGKMEAVTAASLDSAKTAVTLAIGLVGVMAFWLGIMKVAQDAGLLRVLARALKPLMHRLFPGVPAEHPGMSAMIMNLSANMLGLGNAATPFGLKAMIELNKLNKRPGVATDAMCLFAAINTSNVAILPLGVIALRASMDSVAPASILITTFLATLFSTCVAITISKIFVRLPMFAAERHPIDDDIEVDAAAGDDIEIPEEANIDPATTKNKWVLTLILVFCVLMVWATFSHITTAMGQPDANLGDVVRTMLSHWLLPLLIVGFLLYGTAKDVKVYGSLVSGAKEGFDVALKIIPFLVAILVAVGMFRASGAMELLVSGLNPLTSLVGFPGEALPMALLRPLSGSGAYGIAAEIMQTNGPDSFVGFLVSTMQGSTETTFYVLALYFGAAGIRYARHALAACLIADAAGILGAFAVCSYFFAG